MGRIAKRGAVAVALGVSLALGGCSALVSLSNLEGGDAGVDASKKDGASASGEAGAGDASKDATNDALATNDGGSTNDGAAADGSDGAAPSVYRALVMSDGPIMYLRLNDPAGSTKAKDETGTYSPALSGGITFQVAGALAKDSDGAMTFDGTTAAIDVGDALDFSGTNPFTLEAWAKPLVADGEYRFIFAKDSYDDAGREEFGVVAQNGALAFERYVADNGTYASGSLLATLWSHVVAVYDGTTTYLYVNGKQVGMAADTRSQPAKGTHFMVGLQDPKLDGVFAGTLDEIAVYAKVLTATQVSKHYQVGLNGQ
jgi:hypothetical protein